jgi:NADH-quinone oxidoreductase subunit G
MSANPQSTAPATDLVTIEVDGVKLQARKGQMLIEVTDASGAYIPRFCYHKYLSIAANCRMCLVEVEKAPKPLPACATPVMDGMVVRTQSPKARDAQKGTMEFLLINHPLDCPICDQGGECTLQDLSMGYGKDVSRYQEAKRIVKDKNLGPLIATEMTRCIHCTRCVRFGDEIAGIMELGACGRGEHTLIGTLVERSVDSELSGNVIDLCPVGALTSKPYRYSARPWELESRPSVSPHDCIGANLDVQTRRGEVLRVLPRENDAINLCWLADRDRFSYEALNGDDRLTMPMIRRNGKWEETDWSSALEFAAAGLKKVVEKHGANQLGALASPTATLEEFYLLQKLVRALGSSNVDHRLRQSDFRDDAQMPMYPALGQALADLERAKAVLLVGSNPRKDQPLLNLRLRKAALKGARVMAINTLNYDFNYRLSHKAIVEPSAMVGVLARVAAAAAAAKKTTLPAEAERLAEGKPSDTERAMAAALMEEGATVLLGDYALNHPQASVLRTLARLLGETSGARIGLLPPANSAAAWLAGCVPHRGAAGNVTANTGRNAIAMQREPLKGYLLLGVEPELDSLDGSQAVRALTQAEFVVMCTCFKPSFHKSRAVEYAHVWLPLAPFTESEGTFVNAEGRHQSFTAAAPARGEARPGWKILRVLGNRLGVGGFEQIRVEDVRAEIGSAGAAAGVLQSAVFDAGHPPALSPNQLTRIAEVPMYAVDAITRRAPALQATADNPPPAVRVNRMECERLGFKDGEMLRVLSPAGEIRLPLVIDKRVPNGCALIASGYPETVAIGGHGAVTLTRGEA